MQSMLFYYGTEQLLAQLKSGRLTIDQDWSILEPYVSFERWHGRHSPLITEQELLAGFREEYEKLPENIRHLLAFDDFLGQREKLETQVRARLLQNRPAGLKGYERSRLNTAGYLRLFTTALSHFGWHHLANQFQGLCIGISRSAEGFKASEGRPVMIKPVQYGQPHAPLIDASNPIPGAFQDCPEHAARGEWRFVTPTTNRVNPSIKLQKHDVLDIYVSIHAAPELVAAVKQLVSFDMRYRRTRLFEVFPDASHWRLTARPLSL